MVMGPSGCGKSTVGALAAVRAQASFIEADDHHDGAARRRMTAGQALSDDDRMPWLARVAAAANRAPSPVVIACSALNARVRQVLSERLDGEVRFALLSVPPDVLAARLSARQDHFVGPALLGSQLAALDGSGVCTLDGTRPAEALADEAAALLMSG